MLTVSTHMHAACVGCVGCFNNKEEALIFLGPQENVERLREQVRCWPVVHAHHMQLQVALQEWLFPACCTLSHKACHKRLAGPWVC